MRRLVGKLVAVSIGDAPDRARLGFPQREIDRMLLSVCSALVRAGAGVAYGGNLDPDGYSYKIFRHLAGAYATSRDTPFVHFIPESVARFTRYEDLLAILQAGRGVVHTQIARHGALFRARPSADGIHLGTVQVRDDAELGAWFAASPYQSAAEALSAVRRLMNERSDARVILGGRMGVLGLPSDTYEGAAPGVVEEALLALDAGKPLVALGSFGGASRDVAIELGLLAKASKIPRTAQHASYEQALREIAGQRHRIPHALLTDLRAIADDDRAEQSARMAVELIVRWLEERG